MQVSRQCDEIDERRHELKNPLAIMWMERFAVMQRTSNEMTPGKFPGVSQLNGERIHSMPAFSFEKISSPERRVANAPAEKKPRGVIVQILDRFAVKRTRRTPKETIATARPKPKD
jgi:hypothetical protein